MPGLVAVLIAVVGIVGMWWLPLPVVLRDWSCDDSFYYAEIARRLATAGTSSFDGIHPTNGYQPLWTWLQVPIFWLPAGAETAMRLTRSLEILLGLAGFLALAAAARRAGVRPWLVPVLLPFFLSTPALYIGMEAGTSVACVCIAAWAAVRFGGRGDLRDAVVLGVALAACTLARLDNLAFAALVAGALALAGPARPGRVRAALLATAFLPFVAYLIWNWTVFGAPVPVSGLAKQLWSEATPDAGLQRLMRRAGEMWEHRPVREAAILATLVGLAGIVTARRTRGARQALAIVALGLAALAAAKLVYYTLTVEPPFGTYSWYFATSRLLRYVAILWAADWLAHRLPRRIAAARWPGVLVLLGVAVTAGAELRGYATRAADPEPDWEILSWHGARWLDANVAGDEVVGSFDAGVLGHFSKHAVVNLDGLVQSVAFYERRRAGVPLVDELDRLGVTVLANCIVDPDHFFGEKRLPGAAERWQLVHLDDARRARIAGEWRSFAVFRRSR